MNAYIPMTAVVVGILALSSNVAVAQDVSSDTTPSVALPTSGSTHLSYGAGEVVKMVQAGVGNEVIASYINSATAPYRLNADGIIYMKLAGVPSEMTQAMIQRDVQLQQGTGFVQQPVSFQQPVAVAPVPVVYAATSPQSVAAQPPSGGSQVVVVGSDPPPPSVDVTVIGSGYPGYNYYYPYRDGFCYSSGVTFIGGGYTRGWRGICR